MAVELQKLPFNSSVEETSSQPLESAAPALAIPLRRFTLNHVKNDENEAFTKAEYENHQN